MITEYIDWKKASHSECEYRGRNLSCGGLLTAVFASVFCAFLLSFPLGLLDGGSLSGLGFFFRNLKERGIEHGSRVDVYGR